MPQETRPVYVLHGDDPFLRDLHRQEIISRAVGQADPQMCVASFDATAELAEVLDELRTLPFLTPRRVAIVRDADAFVSAYRKPLEAYLEAPAPSGTLVLTVSSWPKNTRLYKLVAKIGETIECSAPDVGRLGRWIEGAASKQNKQIDPAAAELLAQWIGPDLGALSGEIDKLATYIGPRPTITAQDISAVVTASAGPGAFDLTNAITAGDPAAALRALDGMLSGRGDEFKTLGMIAWHLRRAAQAKQLLSAGQRPEAALPRMPYTQRNAFAAMLRRRSMRAFQSDFRRLIAADLAMKTGTDAKAAMQELVLGLCT